MCVHKYNHTYVHAASALLTGQELQGWVLRGGACVVVAGWVEVPIPGAVPEWPCSTTGADFRTIPIALCSVSLDTRSSGRTWARGERQARMDLGRPIHRSNVMNEGRA